MKNISLHRIPIHKNGHVTSLSEILHHINDTNISWRMTELQAISTPSSDLNMLNLESEIRNSPKGFPFTNKALIALAEILDQVIDCEIIGFTVSPEDSPTEEAVIIIRALDSTEWEIAVDESRDLLRTSFD